MSFQLSKIIPSAYQKTVELQNRSELLGERKEEVLKELAKTLIPLFEKNHPIPALTNDYIGEIPYLKPFISFLFPGEFFPPRSRIFAKCNTGWGHQLFVRGNFPGFSSVTWEKGFPMKCLADDLWFFEIPVGDFEYKILMNDDSEKGWEGRATNRFKGGIASEVIAPSFPHFGKTGKDFPAEELEFLNKIYKIQANIEEVYWHVYSETNLDKKNRNLIQLIKEAMLLCTDSNLDPDENCSITDYAVKWIEKFPFTIVFLQQIDPSLVFCSYLRATGDFCTFEDSMRMLCENKKFQRSDHLKFCIERIQKKFESPLERKWAYRILVESLKRINFPGSLFTLLTNYKNDPFHDRLLCIESGKWFLHAQVGQFLDRIGIDESGSFEVFLNSIPNSFHVPISKFPYLSDRTSLLKKEYNSLFTAYNLFCSWNKESVEKACQHLSCFSQARGWGDLHSICERMHATSDPLRQESRLKTLLYFLGMCAHEKVAPERMRTFLEQQTLLEIFDYKKGVRYRLADRWVNLLKDSSIPISPELNCLSLVLQFLTPLGFPEKVGEELLLWKNSDVLSRDALLDILLEVTMRISSDAEMKLFGEKLSEWIKKRNQAAFGEIQQMAPILYVFGKDAFFDCLSEENCEKKVSELLCNLLRLEDKDRDLFLKSYEKLSKDPFSQKKLFSLLKKSIFLTKQKKEAFFLYVKMLIELFDLADPAPSLNDNTLNDDTLKMLTELFAVDGFAKDEKRDTNRELRIQETISEVQGTPLFCERILECVEKDSACLSSVYLRSLPKPNRTCQILRYKRIGHVFNLEGKVEPGKGTVQLEGANETFMFPMLRKTFMDFCSIPGKMNQETQTFFSETLSKAIWSDNASDKAIEAMHQRIHDSKYTYPIMIGTGWDWHATQLIVYKHEEEIHLYHINLGSDCKDKPGIQAVKVGKKDNISIDFLKRIARRHEAQKQDYPSWEKIQKELETTPIEEIPMRAQKVGNCVYKSIKAAFFALLILRFPRDTARSMYKSFCQFDREQVLTDFLQDLKEMGIKELIFEKINSPIGIAQIKNFLNPKLTKQCLRSSQSNISKNLLNQSVETINSFQHRLDLRDNLRRLLKSFHWNHSLYI